MPNAGSSGLRPPSAPRLTSTLLSHGQNSLAILSVNLTSFIIFFTAGKIFSVFCLSLQGAGSGFRGVAFGPLWLDSRQIL